MPVVKLLLYLYTVLTALGGNSLLDLVVFGRATGLHLGETLAAQTEARPATESDIEASLARDALGKQHRW